MSWSRTGSSRSMKWTKNSRFPFGPGSPESTTPIAVAPQPRPAATTPPGTGGAARRAPPPPAAPRVAYRAEHAAVPLGVAHDASLAHVGATGLELRLDEDDRVPA